MRYSPIQAAHRWVIDKPDIIGSLTWDGKNFVLIPPLWRVKTATLAARRATATRKPASAGKPSSSSRQKKEQYQVFGKHLTIDAYGIDEEKLRSHKGVFDLLDDLPGWLGMRKLITPYVVFCQEGDKQGDWGLSGFVMIYESHISAHTWPELGYVSMDVYSCRDFDENKVLKILKDYWGATKINSQVISRG